ncbi:MAG: hypothetical protein ABI208_03705 [Ginsengibacter sp.]|jgi:hypothetical protein
MKLKLLSVLCIIFGLTAQSQGVTDDGILNQQVKTASEFYYNTLGPQADIYYGRDYTPYLFKMEGTPFFMVNELQDGWVSYKGHVYNGIRLQFDVQRNQIVILNKFNSTRSYLENKYVDSFQVANHTFVKLQEDRKVNLYTSGFFEVLYRGPATLVTLRKKEIREVIKDNVLIRIFDPKDAYFIFKSGKYYAVENRNDVVRVLGDKVEKKMRDQDVRFRRDNFELALFIAVQVYDQLSN